MCMFRFFHLLASSFFAISAYVQKNDPDSSIWVTIYFIPAIISFCTSIVPSFTENDWVRGLNTAIIIICGLMSANILRNENEDWTDEGLFNWLIQDEEGRECSGLFIILLWTFFMHGTTKYVSFLRTMVTSSIIVLPICLWVYIYKHEEFRRYWPVHCLTLFYPNNDIGDDDDNEM